MKYVDGFLLVVPKKKLRAYAALAKKAGRIWLEHGALECRECAAEDMATSCGIPFPKRVQAKATETVVFSWIVYKSRAHRDRVNGKVMADPRIARMMKAPPPFDMNKMSHGGFETLVDL
jgi:uncharacterized protein YbaA (DUF1428 family)